MKTRIVVTALINLQNKYVFIRKHGEEIFHIPGGAIEEGELVEEGLKREIMEECNIEIQNIKPIGFMTQVKEHDGMVQQSIYLRFTADYLSGELKPGDDAVEAVAMAVEEIDPQTHNPYTIKLLKELNVLLPSINIKVI